MSRSPTKRELAADAAKVESLLRLLKVHGTLHLFVDRVNFGSPRCRVLQLEHGRLKCIWRYASLLNDPWSASCFVGNRSRPRTVLNAMLRYDRRTSIAILGVSTVECPKGLVRI